MNNGPMRFWYRVSRFLIRMFFRVFFGLRVRGLENVPVTGRILFVSNHISNVDPPVIGSLIRREVYFAAKMELFTGLLGKWVRYHNAIPIRRHGSDKEAIRTLVQRLKEDYAVLIFPEGTRTPDPDAAQIKAGAGMLALKGESDLFPLRIDGSQYVPKNIFRPGAITVMFGSRIRLADLLEDNPPKKEAYSRITDAVMQQIRAMKPGT